MDVKQVGPRVGSALRCRKVASAGSAGRVRVTAQLIDADDMAITSWAERYDRACGGRVCRPG